MSEFKLPSGNRLMFIGFVLVVLGLGAIIAPSVAGEAVIFLIGGLLVVTGAFEFVTGWRQDTAATKLLTMIQGAIFSLTGVVVLAHPYYGLAALTLILAIFFLVSGIWRIIASFSYRPAKGWLALLASGLLSLILGWLIWQEWPLSGQWAVGILVGVDLLSGGIALIAIALTWKQAMLK